MREKEREMAVNNYHITKLSSYGMLHDPIDEFTSRRGIRIHRIQGSSIAIPLFTNRMVNLHVHVMYDAVYTLQACTCT